MKSLLKWLGCVGCVLICGCGMFGDTRLYTGLLALCAKCHASADAPAKSNAIPGAAGMQGATGKLVGFRCEFTMDHSKGVRP